MLDKPPTLYYCNGSCENPSNWYVDTGFTAMLNFSGAFGSIDSFALYNNTMYVTSGGTVYCFNGTDWSVIKTYDDVYAFLDTQVYNDKLYLATRDQAWRKPFYQGGTGFSGRVIEYNRSKLDYSVRPWLLNILTGNLRRHTVCWNSKQNPHLQRNKLGNLIQRHRRSILRYFHDNLRWQNICGNGQ